MFVSLYSCVFPFLHLINRGEYGCLGYEINRHLSGNTRSYWKIRTSHCIVLVFINKVSLRILSWADLLHESTCELCYIAYSYCNLYNLKLI